jgi:hypothetical protein
MITLKVQGLDKVRSFTDRLPTAVRRGVKKSSLEFARFVQKSAKLRAPRGATGFMRSQITVRSTKKEIIIDTGVAYYAYYQEFGFTGHWIPIEYFRQHRTSPNIPGIPVKNPRGFRFVRRNKPFMIPALEAGIIRLPMILGRGIKGAINKAKRR